MIVTDTQIIETRLDVTSNDWDIAIKFLDDHIELSKGRLKDAMNKGAVWLRRGPERSRLRRAKTQLYVGDQIEVFYNEDVLTPLPKELNLIEDRGDYSIWNKPSGMMTQGSDWGDFNSVERQVELMCHNERQIFLVQELEREASGLILVAHHKRVASDLSAMFQSGGIQKRYRVEVQGELPDQGEINLALDGQPAVTAYQRVSYSDHSNSSKADVLLDAEQRHQLRRHFDGIGHSVMGDPLYGNEHQTRSGMQLKITAMRFLCPVSKKENAFSLY